MTQGCDSVLFFSSLNFPGIKKIFRQGRTVIGVSPYEWKLTDLALVLEMASKAVNARVEIISDVV